jgi:hypothetical protein
MVTRIVIRARNCLFLVDFESNVLYQDVYLRLNGINLPVEATPAPCTAGSETVCPVRAGAVNQYSAVVNFSSDLPPVSYINSFLVPYEKYDIFIVHVSMRRKGSKWRLIYFKETEVMCIVTYKSDLR